MTLPIASPRLEAPLRRRDYKMPGFLQPPDLPTDKTGSTPSPEVRIGSISRPRGLKRTRALVRAYERGDPLPKEVKIPERTVRFWAAQCRIAEEIYGTDYVGVIPRRRRGNTMPKLSASTLSLMNDFVENVYETLKQKRKYEVYAAFLRACEQRGILPTSYKTFIKAVKLRPRYQQVAKRQGRKAAYKHKEFYWELALTTPRHGERPFHVAHIDHTELDAELVCSTTGQNLGRAWLTLLMDAFSRRILYWNHKFAGRYWKHQIAGTANLWFQFQLTQLWGAA